MYSAEDRDTRGAEQDYKKLERELDKKIKRTPTDHHGYNEYQYHLDPIEHDPWPVSYTHLDVYKRQALHGTGRSASASVCGTFWGRMWTITPMKP